MIWWYNWISLLTLRWRHNDHDGVSNHQPHGCLFNRLFRLKSKKTSKLGVTGLCVGNSPGPVNSPHKGPVTRKMFPFDDVIMEIDLLTTTHQCLDKIAYISQTIFWNAFYRIKLFSFKFNRKLTTDIESSLVQVMAWGRAYGKPIPEPITT